jgi:hypothetical protein
VLKFKKKFRRQKNTKSTFIKHQTCSNCSPVKCGKSDIVSLTSEVQISYGKLRIIFPVRFCTCCPQIGLRQLLWTFATKILEEESAILSAREKGFSIQRGFGNIIRGASRVSMQASDRGSSCKEQVLKGSGRRPGFIARVETEGLLHPGRGVSANRREGSYKVLRCSIIFSVKPA